MLFNETSLRKTHNLALHWLKNTFNISVQCLPRKSLDFGGDAALHLGELLVALRVPQLEDDHEGDDEELRDQFKWISIDFVEHHVQAWSAIVTPVRVTVWLQWQMW